MFRLHLSIYLICLWFIDFVFIDVCTVYTPLKTCLTDYFFFLTFPLLRNYAPTRYFSTLFFHAALRFSLQFPNVFFSTNLFWSFSLLVFHINRTRKQTLQKMRLKSSTNDKYVGEFQNIKIQQDIRKRK